MMCYPLPMYVLETYANLNLLHMFEFSAHKPVCALEQMTSRHQTQSYKPREPKVQPNGM